MEVETNEYLENRLAAMAELEKLGFRPYGRAYEHDDLAKIREEFEEGKEVSAAGRLLMIRRMGLRWCRGGWWLCRRRCSPPRGRE